MIREKDPGLALPLALEGAAGDDPRVVTALEEYLEALNAGRPLARDDFLARHSEIAGALNPCLSGLEFIHVAGVQLGGAVVVAVRSRHTRFLECSTGGLSNPA